MVKYDSSVHELSLQKVILLSDGTTPMELTGKLDLTGLSEPERQLIIAVAKLVTNWCAGHDVDKSTVSKKGEEIVTNPSPLSKVNSMIARATKDKPEVSEGQPHESD